MTHSFATMEVPAHVYAIIKAKLEEVGYHHAIMEGGELDMHGIALVAEPAVPIYLEGSITAPEGSGQAIREAGFEIKVKGKLEKGLAVYHVKGLAECLAKIDHRWGDWIWSLEHSAQT